MSEIRDQVVVITGASGGIGAALARLVGRRGGRPVLAARRASELNQAAEQSGAQALAVVTDVTRRDQVRRLFDAALERFGQIDVWVNNAGRGITRTVAELKDEDLDEMMLVNVKSALYGVQAVLPHFRSRRRGHIINVSSMLGRVPSVPTRSAYSAAKHALNALTACLRMELRPEYPDIHVSTVMPGVVATEFGRNALGGGRDSREIPGAETPEDTAEVIADLIEHPRSEVYTRPGFKDRVVAYYSAEDVATVAAGPTTAPAARRS